MSETMARALGAKGAMTVTIAEKECQTRALGIAELTEIERECLDRYKRQYLRTFVQNLDMIPKGKRDSILEKKMEEVAKWDIDDLPPKFAHDPTRIKVTSELKSWLKPTMLKICVFWPGNSG